MQFAAGLVAFTVPIVFGLGASSLIGFLLVNWMDHG